MLKENKEVVVEKQQTDFYISTLERPNKGNIVEQRIHEKLGDDFHKYQAKRLTPEEKEILRKGKDWKLNEIPEDGQTKFQNFLQVSNKLSEWNKYFGETADPKAVKTEYDKPKETHTPQDLRPINLPNNGETELGRIPELEKRPTQEQLNNAVNQATNSKAKDKLDEGIKIFGIETPQSVKNRLDSKPVEGVILNADEIEAINNYVEVKNTLKKGTDAFPTKKPQDILNALNAKPIGIILTAEQEEAITNYLTVKNGLSEGKTAFGTKTAKQVKDDLDARPILTKEDKEAIKNYGTVKNERDNLNTRLTTSINNLHTEQFKNKALSDEVDLLKKKLGNPLENVIEDKLKEVVISEEGNYPRLLETFKRFTDGRNSEDKEKRKVIYKYGKAITKNVEGLEREVNASDISQTY